MAGTLPPALRDSAVPYIAAPIPFPARVSYGIHLWLLKILSKIFFAYIRYVKPEPEETRPTYIKRYPVRSMIKNRVFVPRSYKAGEKALPLYIDIHGGGFAVCDPQVDDEFCSMLANKYGICVVSIGYRLSPRFQHPTQVQDVMAIAQAVLDDEDLPCSKHQVMIGGFSAGGNLAMAASQSNELKGKFAGLVSFYPPLDYTVSMAKKLERKTEGREDLDKLAKLAMPFNWGHVPAGYDRTDPLLSPMYAERNCLPKKICLTGCGLDMLCQEAQDKAEELANHESGVKKSLEVGTGWEKGGVRWERMVGREHGFDFASSEGEKGLDNKRLAIQMREGAIKWLLKEVYA
ncbi:hypothetical protein MMC09_005357 [Bachmanniomyces sp. S44760]|nr:hypothetical protein [Bachmanniomyces sp. S44760]